MSEQRYGGHGRFVDRLRRGQVGEGVVSHWARRLGFSVIPLGDLPPSAHGGPRLPAPGARELLSPDLLLIRDGAPLFLEVKRKARFSLHQATGDLVTGIEARALDGYREVARVTGVPTFLGFWHGDSHPACFIGGEIDYLAHRVHHEHDFRNGTMLYWARDALKDLARHPAFRPAYEDDEPPEPPEGASALPVGPDGWEFK